jgi:hypothetical protein
VPTEQTELTREQTELIEKLNCLEFETSQLNRAYQLWRSYIEQGKTSDWMSAAIRITYDDLIEAVSEQPAIQQGQQEEETLRQLWAKALVYDASKEPSPELLAMTEPDSSGPEMPVAISPPSTSDAISEQPANQQGQQEEETLRQLWAKALVYDTTAQPSGELSPMTEPDWSGPEMPVAICPPSTGDVISDQPAIQLGQEKCNCRECARARDEAAGADILGILGEENTTAESSPELLPMTEPDWSRPEMPVAVSPPPTGDTISEEPSIQQGWQEEEAGAELAAIHIPAALANWLQGSSTGMVFLAGFVAILIVAGGAMGIYMASAQHGAPGPAILRVQNSAAQAAAGALAIPTGGKAGFKFDPDPVVARLGRSFVLNAVLARGSDIASVAAQIDYDANLLQFMSVSEGGFLVKDGQHVVLVQRDDPSTGVLRITADKSPGNPGISGDGPVFTLSFQARKRGNATVSIVPGAHDSQGRRIEMSGSQVSVRVN